MSEQQSNSRCQGSRQSLYVLALYKLQMSRENINLGYQERKQIQNVKVVMEAHMSRVKNQGYQIKKNRHEIIRETSLWLLTFPYPWPELLDVEGVGEAAGFSSSDRTLQRSVTSITSLARQWHFKPRVPTHVGVHISRVDVWREIISIMPVLTTQS